jgi:hypothetical protein
MASSATSNQREHEMRGRGHHAQDVEEAARMVADGLRSGELNLRQAVGLTDSEVQAVADLAEQLRRTGAYQQSISVLGLLLTYDPFVAKHWERLGDLHSRLGQHPASVACFEVVALLRDRDRALTTKEARSLRKMGHRDLAAQLVSASG